MTVDPIELTCQMVRCPSITPTDAGVQDILMSSLQKLGFNCTKLPFGDVQNIFARRGTGGPHLCFAGHTDVVPPGDEKNWAYPPFTAEIRDGKIYGRGTADMKGNIAAFVAAISRYQGRGSISLLITGDEEGPAINGTVKVLEWMKANNQIPDACIVGEPTNPEHIGDEIKIGRRGSLSAILTVQGVQGHVAYPDRAHNPVPDIARIITAISHEKLDCGSDHFGPSTLQFTNIHTANTADNVIPGQASARFNVRFNDHWTHEKLEDRIRKTINALGIPYQIHFIHGARSFITRPGPLTDLVQKAVHDVTDRVPKLSTSGGTSDARFIHQYCPVVEFGLVNSMIHKTDEYIEIAHLKQLEDVYLEIIQRYLQ